jgi:hypothetical protein
MPSLPSDLQVNQYIQQQAARLGINPSVAVSISEAERGPRSGGWIGDSGSSFGPFQLHLGGISSTDPGSGLGDAFKTKTGLDPRNIADTWQQQIDFALEWARDVSGWEPFHAAQRLGYGVWDGIRTAAGNAANALSYYFPLVGYSGDPKATYHTPGASDLFAPAGTAIRSVSDGRVSAVSASGPGGNALIIHGLDGLDYYYAHLQESPSVQPGDYVAAGQDIGKVGNTGNASTTQPHLHLGIGYGISTGTGAAGGAGRNFDAQTFLTNILAAGGASASGSGVASSVAGAAVTDIGGSVRSGITGATGTIVQDVQNYVKDRAASIILVTAGIFLLLVGVWGVFMQTDAGRAIVKTGAGVVGGPVGIAASAL